MQNIQKIYTDQVISKKITQNLSPSDKNPKFHQLTQSFIIPHSRGSKLIYLSYAHPPLFNNNSNNNNKNTSSQKISTPLIYLTIIDHRNVNESQIVQTWPLKFFYRQYQLKQIQKQLLFSQRRLELIQNRYDENIFVMKVIQKGNINNGKNNQQGNNVITDIQKQKIKYLFFFNINFQFIQSQNMGHLRVDKFWAIENNLNRHSHNSNQFSLNSYENNQNNHKNQLIDVQWHEYHICGLVLLYEEKIQCYNMLKDQFNPVEEMWFRDISIKGNGQKYYERNQRNQRNRRNTNINIPEFVKIRFVDDNNWQDHHHNNNHSNNKQSSPFLSLSLSTSLFLLTSSNQIYLLSFLLFDGILLSHSQYTQINQFMTNFDSYNYQNNEQKILFDFIINRNVKFIKLSQNDVIDIGKQDLWYCVQVAQNSNSNNLKHISSSSSIYKLNNMKQSHKHDKYSSIHSPSSLINKIKQICDFHIFLLKSHIIFISCYQNIQNHGVIKLQIFSSQTYNRMLYQNNRQNNINNHLNLDFNVQTVGEIDCGKLNDFIKSKDINNKQNYFNASQMIRLLHPLRYNHKKNSKNDKNCLFFAINRQVCYQISMNGLERLLDKQVTMLNKQNQYQHYQQENCSDHQNLLQVDIIFQLKTQYYNICRSPSTIYLLRYLHTKKQFKFDTIVLEGLKLKQKIRKANQQTQELFNKLLEQIKSENLANKEKQQQNKQILSNKALLKQFNPESIFELQKKLQGFSQQFKKSVVLRLERIKVLYEKIKQQAGKIQKYNEDKKIIYQLVQKIQQNQSKIQKLVESNSKNNQNLAEPMSKSQQQISRKSQAASKFISGLQQQIEKKYFNLMSSDNNKAGIVRQCEKKADNVYNSLFQLKMRLIEKRDVLRKVNM